MLGEGLEAGLEVEDRTAAGDVEEGTAAGLELEL
jgi:hypothetical protein